MPALSGEATHQDPRQLFEVFLMSAHNQMPSDVLQLVHSSLTPVSELSVVDLKKYSDGGHGPAFAYLGMRHFWGVGGIMIDHARANELFVSAIECDDCIEGWGMLLCANASDAGATSLAVPSLYNGLTPLGIAAKLEDKGLWDIILNDEAAHSACLFAIVGVGYGWLKIPPERMADLIPSVVKGGTGYVEKRTRSMWFYGFEATVTVALACLAAQGDCRGGSSDDPYDFSQLEALCDRFGSFGVTLFNFSANALSVGRHPSFAGKLSKDTMNRLAEVMYRFLCEDPVSGHNLASAHFELGLSYNGGSLGIKQNFANAFAHFEQGAERGHNSCLYSLAAYYQTGIGGVAARDLEYANSLRARMTGNSQRAIHHLGFFHPGANDTPELFDDSQHATLAAAAGCSTAGLPEPDKGQDGPS